MWDLRDFRVTQLHNWSEAGTRNLIWLTFIKINFAHSVNFARSRKFANLFDSEKWLTDTPWVLTFFFILFIMIQPPRNVTFVIILHRLQCWTLLPIRVVIFSARFRQQTRDYNFFDGSSSSSSARERSLTNWKNMFFGEISLFVYSWKFQVKIPLTLNIENQTLLDRKFVQKFTSFQFSPVTLVEW